MAVLVILTLEDEVATVFIDPVSAWTTAKDAVHRGFGAYVYESSSNQFKEVGEYGWKHCPNPPEIVKLTQMLY